MSQNKIRILSRKSDLAIIQAREIGYNLLSYFPDLKIEYLTKSTSGDKDLKTPLSKMSSAGVFTDDLRKNLIQNKCDIIVHSWKDLPIDLGNDTMIAGTIKRSDQRDILFIKKNNVLNIQKKKIISILSSSPRRVYNLELFAKNYLPFGIKKVEFLNIRGNIPTRFKKFINGSDDAFIVAKAAIDRLLNNKLEEFDQLKNLIQTYIENCLWTITPLSLNPTSPGQGALACEIRKNDKFSNKLLKQINNIEDYNCVQKERKLLEKYGGGCHQKIGISFFKTHFGIMHSSKGEVEKGNSFQYWKKLTSERKFKRKIYSKEIFPENLKDYNFFKRKFIKENLKKIQDLERHCIFITRNIALPNEAKVKENNIFWTSGITTWKKLSQRGIWVNGSSDGMGEDFATQVHTLNKHTWIKLTHKDSPNSSIQKRIHTYELIRKPIKEDFKNKKYFYWMSSSAFKYAIEQNPNIINKFHSCGPGNTYKAIKKMLGKNKNLKIFLSYESWKNYLLAK